MVYMSDYTCDVCLLINRSSIQLDTRISNERA